MEIFLVSGIEKLCKVLFSRFVPQNHQRFPFAQSSVITFFVCTANCLCNPQYTHFSGRGKSGAMRTFFERTFEEFEWREKIQDEVHEFKVHLVRLSCWLLRKKICYTKVDCRVTTIASVDLYTWSKSKCWFTARWILLLREACVLLSRWLLKQSARYSTRSASRINIITF